jgi:hypothetical protein
MQARIESGSAPQRRAKQDRSLQTDQTQPRRTRLEACVQSLPREARRYRERQGPFRATCICSSHQKPGCPHMVFPQVEPCRSSESIAQMGARRLLECPSCVATGRVVCRLSRRRSVPRSLHFGACDLRCDPSRRTWPHEGAHRNRPKACAEYAGGVVSSRILRGRPVASQRDRARTSRAQLERPLRSPPHPSSAPPASCRAAS